MRRLIKQVDPVSEYLARKLATLEEQHDKLRCGHPGGPMKCSQLVACHQCPFAEALELDLAA
jgi:hypothetical protein